MLSSLGLLVQRVLSSRRYHPLAGTATRSVAREQATIRRGACGVQERPSSPKDPPRRRWILAACVLAFAAVAVTTGQRLFTDNRWLQPPFETPPYDRHIDEYAWYHYTYHYHLVFHEGDLAFSDWGDDVPAIGQPNVYKLVLGGWLDCLGLPVNTSEDRMRSWWQPMTDDDTFKAFLAEHLPFPDETLLAGRLLSAVFSYLTIILCVVYVMRLTNLVLAVVAAVFISNLQLFGVTRMMSDSLLMLAFLVCFLLFDLIVECRRPRRRAALVVIGSVVVGLTMGIKLTGFAALAFLPAWWLCDCLRTRTRAACRAAAAWSAAHVAIAFAVFVALHPQVYPNPVAGTVRFFSHQVPATLGHEAGLLARMQDELSYQLGELAVNLGATLRLEGQRGICTVVVALLLALGLGGLVVGRRGTRTASRVLPLLLTVLSFTMMLSHRLDERYTWLVTIVLSMFVIFGCEVLVRWGRTLASAGGLLKPKT